MKSLVVGGGPAGLLSAIVCANAGCEVVIVDRSEGGAQHHSQRVHILRSEILETAALLDPELGKQLK
ncbi:MAG: FAD-dependent monooxygenase [Cyanobacteria bacterium P01_F01_bin.42]